MDTTALLLAPGQALTLPPGPAGRRLRVLQGRVWLTISGNAEDFFVVAGEELALGACGPGGVVVQAEGREAASLRWTAAPGAVDLGARPHEAAAGAPPRQQVAAG
ncbi:MAG: DUF2917 domain-containing protein [Rubrivivax sp.]